MLKRKLYLKRKLVKKTITFFKKGYSGTEIAKRLGISYAKLREMLEIAKDRKLLQKSSIPLLKKLYFKKKIINKILPLLKNGYNNEQVAKSLKINLRQSTKFINRARVIIAKEKRVEKNKSRILEIRKLYSELGSLENVAKKINLTRERVRQLLKQGEEYGLYEYETYNKEYTKKLANRYSKDALIKEIMLHGSLNKFKTTSGLSNVDVNRLMNFYNIDKPYTNVLLRDKRDLRQYQEIVNILGHHPTTTELQTKTDWRKLRCRLNHRYKGFNNFRKSYGIPAPPKGYARFRDKTIPLGIAALRARAKLIRDEKETKVINLLKEVQMPLTYAEAASRLNMRKETARRYLMGLASQGKINTENIGIQKFYISKEINPDLYNKWKNSFSAKYIEKKPSMKYVAVSRKILTPEIKQFSIDCYINYSMSCQQIKEEIKKKYGVSFTSCCIWTMLKNRGLTRSITEALKIRDANKSKTTTSYHKDLIQNNQVRPTNI